jgi:hypothetical protein
MEEDDQEQDEDEGGSELVEVLGCGESVPVGIAQEEGKDGQE